jgi:hypothetical protein
MTKSLTEQIFMVYVWNWLEKKALINFMLKATCAQGCQIFPDTIYQNGENISNYN